MSRVSHAIDRIRVSFEDRTWWPTPGCSLVGTVAVRLQLERLVNAKVQLTGRVGVHARAASC